MLKAARWAAILPVLVAAEASAQPPPAVPVAAVDFDHTTLVPERVLEQYQSLFADSKVAEVAPPKLSPAFVKLRDIEKGGVFVRVDSALACSASGQCQTDLFDLSGGRPVLIFSAPVENIGLVKPVNPHNYPVILTNIPKDEFSRIKAAKGQSTINPLTARGNWHWDGKSYVVSPGPSAG